MIMLSFLHPVGLIPIVAGLWLSIVRDYIFTWLRGQMSDELLLVKKLSDKARVPTRGSSGAAGYDLYSAKTMLIRPHSRAIVPTDISIKIPCGAYGRVAPRSGLAVNYFIDVGAGVVDRDYRGPLGVVLFNFADTDFEIKQGDRIAQLIVEKIHTDGIREVSELDYTDRGSCGFGSTDKSVSL